MYLKYLIGSDTLLVLILGIGEIFCYKTNMSQDDCIVPLTFFWTVNNNMHQT